MYYQTCKFVLKIKINKNNNTALIQLFQSKEHDLIMYSIVIIIEYTLSAGQYTVFNAYILA